VLQKLGDCAANGARGRAFEGQTFGACGNFRVAPRRAPVPGDDEDGDPEDVFF